MVRLTEKEREIIVAAQFMAEHPVRDIQQLTGLHEHTIRYTLDKALASGLIQKRCFIDLNLLGYSQYQIFLTPISERKNFRSALLGELIKNEKVSWAGELGGDFHFGMNICVRNVLEVGQFLEEISTKSKIKLLDKLIAARIKLAHFGYGFLAPKMIVGKPLEYQALAKQIEIDELDHTILKEIVKPNFPSRREIARSLSLPFSTLEYRLKKLEQTGIIRGYYYTVNAALLGYQSFVVQLRTKEVSKSVKKAIYNFCIEHPSAVVYIESIGAWDFEIYFQVLEAREIMSITQELHDKFSSTLQSLKVVSVLGYHKLQEYPFTSFSSLGNKTK